MSDVVAGAIKIRLGDVLFQDIDKTGPVDGEVFTYVDISSIDRDSKKITDAKKISAGDAPSRAKQRLKAGDVLVSMTRPNLNAVAMVPNQLDQAIGSTGFHILRTRHADPKYIFNLVQTREFIDSLCQCVQGALYPAVRPADVESFEFLLPPAAEQQRIVSKLEELFSELDTGVENLRTAQQQLKVYRQALLKQAFEGKLTAEWRAQNPDMLESVVALLARIQQEREARYQRQFAEWQEAQKDWEATDKTGSKPAKPKEPKAPPPLTAEELAELPELPVGWVYVKAEAISDFITKGTTPGKELLFDGTGEIPFIKVYNLTKTGALDFTISPTFVSHDTHNGFLARSKVYPGDVLMNIVGPPLGKVSIVPESYPEWNINQAIAIYRSELIQSKLLAAFLSSEINVRRMMSKSKATAGQFNLTLEICRDTIIPLCGVKEQEQLSRMLDEKLSNLDQLEKTIADTLQQAETLRQSILKKAFSGQLVPQQFDDEPVSVLLERIRAERSAQQQPAVKRGRKVAKPA